MFLSSICSYTHIFSKYQSTLKLHILNNLIINDKKKVNANLKIQFDMAKMYTLFSLLVSNVLS